MGRGYPAAKRLAEVLEVDLHALQTAHDPAEGASPDEAAGGAVEPTTGPVRTRIVYRQVHQAYLKVHLGRAVGSAYDAAMDEREIEKHCKRLPWDEVIGVVSARKREMEVLGEVVRDADLLADVRSFLEEALNGYPELDIRLLAAARGRERSEEGWDKLTRAMRELL